MNGLRYSLTGLAATTALVTAGHALAAAPDAFPLGQSAKTGAVCAAVRDYEDPAAQLRGASAWVVRCRGWSTPLGHLYLFGRDRRAGEAAWRQALSARAECQPGMALTLAGLGAATESRCQTIKGQTPYAAYATAEQGAASEGFAPLADLLQTGLKVIVGAAPVPVPTQAQAAAAGQAGVTDVGLSAAVDAAYGPADQGRDYAYTQNQAWRFPRAEESWRPLATGQQMAGADKAEATLNWALAFSNLGRFDQAQRLFARADAELQGLDDPFLAALSFNYKALDARNRKDFQAAIALAQQSIDARRQIRQSAGGVIPVSGGANDLYINRILSDALNRRDRTGVFTPPNLSTDQRLDIPDAQAELVIGTAQVSLGDDAAARQALRSAQAKLTDPQVLNSVVWLKAQVEAELARLDLKDGKSADAVERLKTVLAAMHHGADAAYLAGSPVEAYVLFQLGRAEAAIGRSDQALADYDQGFAIFRQARGSLGASADAAGTYFDLLLAKRASDPASERADDERYFQGLQSVVSEATASTVADLANRIGAGAGAAAGTARAVEDTRRQIAAKRVALDDLAGQAGAAVARQADEADIRALSEQEAVLEGQLLNADPRYGELEIGVVSLDRMQKALAPGEAYLRVVLLGEKSYAILITSQAVRPYAVDLGRQAVADLVQRLRKPFDSSTLSRFDVDGAHRLYAALLGPAQAEMVGVTHLIYDPDGPLISLPVATLVADQASVELMASRLADIKAKGRGFLSYQGVNWLGRTVDSSLEVSAASFLQSRALARSAARAPFIGFGDAVIGPASDPRTFEAVVGPGRRGGEALNFCEDQRRAMTGLRRLTETAGEVQTVGSDLGAASDDVVLGPAFTDTGVESRQDLDQFRVVYFATHGLLPAPGWCLPQPALVTSLGGEGSDGLLEAGSILNLKLDADLVVLSACNTGGGAYAGAAGAMNDGDALGGLARAFIYAGSRGLVVSHWEVDSASTLALMTGMFGAARAGENPGEAEALRRSELTLMDSPDRSHPYYWAAFTVVGDGARPMPGRAGTAM